MGLVNQLKTTLGDNYTIGDRFEAYVLDLFPEKAFRLLHATTRRDDLHGRKVESALNPDFQLEHKSTQKRFGVECKFRTSKSVIDRKLKWCQEYQLRRYREFQEKTQNERVFVALGFEGSPSSPEKLYCFPVDEMKHWSLYFDLLEKYRRPTDKQFWYEDGRLM